MIMSSQIMSGKMSLRHAKGDHVSRGDLSRRVWLGLVVVLLMGPVCREGKAAPVHEGDAYSASENTGGGYLMAPSLSPGHNLRPSPMFALPAMEAAGTGRVDFDVHWGNLWNYKPDQYMIDGEWSRNALRYSYAVEDDLSVGLAVPIIGRTGGFTDSAIEKFHSVLKMGNAERNIVERNRSLATVTDAGGTHTVAEDESWGIGDVSAFVSYRLTEGTSYLPAVTVQAEVFLPTGDEHELRGLGGPAIAVSSVASKRLGASPFVTFLGVGFSYCDAVDIEAIKVRDEQISGLAGVGYQYSRSLEFLVQYLVNSPWADNYFALSKPSHEISVGFKWCAGPDYTVELAMDENLFVFQNSADIGVHFAIGRRL